MNNSGSLQNWGALEHRHLQRGCDYPLTQAPIWVSMPNLIAVGQEVQAYANDVRRMKIRHKMGSSRPAFQGNLRSSLWTVINRITVTSE